jgi:glyoxylase-like metal-dependent hydrolase (beta-lactamase superfamily II)
MTTPVAPSLLTMLSENLFRFPDMASVYILRHGTDAVLIDFGSGAVLDALPGLGITRATGVLMTHHHRDQGQGLARAVAEGIPVWVPQTEQELFHSVDVHWQAREVFNNYNTREDRFSLLEPVPVAGLLHDYSTYTVGGYEIQVLPTPGHTPGSISLLAEVDGQRVAFTGDLIAGPGKVWSLAATQWSYNGAEGVAASIPSLLELKAQRPDLLLPSHGQPITEPGPAIDLLVERLRALLAQRRENPRLFLFMDQPFEALTPHLLQNRTSLANSYVLLSQSGKALVLDYGYDFTTGIPAGQDRAAKRPSLYTLRHLKRDYGVTRVDVAIPTHYHDDHVAGFNLLREVEGTRVWAPENFAPILEHPMRHNLPCVWFDPIPVDAVLPLATPVAWEEHALTLYPLTGHTRFACAIFFEVDGKRVLVTGDQYQDSDGTKWNYVYQNGFSPADYSRSAALYRKLQPDLILSGHWSPLWVDPGYFDRLDAMGAALERLHADLLPLEVLDVGAEGPIARIEPYTVTAAAGTRQTFVVETRNPFPHTADAVVRLVVPEGWAADPREAHCPVIAHATATNRFEVSTPAGRVIRRARIAADVTIAGQPFGQQAEALVTLTL